MGKATLINWCHHTWNLIWGCTKVAGSPACAFCYAEAFSRRLGLDLWGKDKPRRTFGEKYWAEPLKWDRAAAEAGERRRVFCSSMGDVFEDHPTVDAEREKLWPLIGKTPHLDWLLLTKRPKRIAESLPDDWVRGYSNVWLGTTVEDQRHADERIPALTAVPAAVRFLSVEPLLGPVTVFGDPNRDEGGPGLEAVGYSYPTDYGTGTEWDADYSPAIDWVIVGGESGPKARPMDLAWARAVVDDCVAWQVPVWVKQLGGARDKRELVEGFPPELRIRELPAVGARCAL